MTIKNRKQGRHSKTRRPTPTKRSARRSTARKHPDETIGNGGEYLRSDSGSQAFRNVSPAAIKKMPPQRAEQSGDLEGLETAEREGFESVAELVEEGQNLEAAQLEGIERTPEPDQSELKPRKLPNPSNPRKFEDRNRL